MAETRLPTSEEVGGPLGQRAIQWYQSMREAPYRNPLLEEALFGPPIFRAWAGPLDDETQDEPSQYQQEHVKLEEEMTRPLAPEAYPIRLLPATDGMTLREFAQLFCHHTNQHGLRIRAIAYGIDQLGYKMTVQNCRALTALWEVREDIEAVTGWKLLPRPPLQIITRLDDLPQGLTKSELLDELFQPRHTFLTKVRAIRNEIKILRLAQRTAYLKGPPEFRETIILDEETVGLLIQGRKIQASDCFPLGICGYCSGHRHDANSCTAEQLRCGYCAEDHHTDFCHKKLLPASYKCPNCTAALLPVEDCQHTAMDTEVCPFAKDAVNERIRQTEYRPSIYRELLRIWHKHGSKRPPRNATTEADPMHRAMGRARPHDDQTATRAAEPEEATTIETADDEDSTELAHPPSERPA